MAYLKESTIAFLKSLEKGLKPSVVTKKNNSKLNGKSKIMTFKIKRK